MGDYDMRAGAGAMTSMYAAYQTIRVKGQITPADKEEARDTARWLRWMGPQDIITKVDLPDFNKAKEIHQILHSRGLTDITALNWQQFMTPITELSTKK